MLRMRSYGLQKKMPLATSTEYGNSLFNVHTLKKKTQSLATEIDNHEPRINSVCNNGQKLIDEGHEDSAEFATLINDLLKRWQNLKDAVDNRKNMLDQSERAQQYFFDANEAESWMSEQELYMMVEDRGKDEISAQNLMKKHETLELAVEDYSETIRQLGETARQLTSDHHPHSDLIAVKQSQVDKLYAGLKDLAGERRAKLDEALQLFMLNREVDDLEQWITDRELVAGSHELGQDYDHVTLLWERFKEFARDTEATGTERVAAVNTIADQLISAGHSDSATIAEWKDGLNEAWQDLLELIETRTQMLVASRELHKFFHDCKDVLGRISEKQHAMSDELGRDAGSVNTLQRKHQTFLQDLLTLQSQVQQIEEESAKLQASYAGDKAKEITNREAEVRGAWAALQAMCDARKQKLADTGDLFKFFNMVRTLMLWMDDVVRQMNTSEKPRDVSGVELLMNNHQSLKAEIDTREDNFTACISLGKELLSRNHYASNEIKEKLLSLSNQRNSLLHRWEERWENLQLILEVYQFARDAAVAEAWLIAQEPYLLSLELGHTIDEVENLIKKHEAFEKSATAQEERFIALERLTTFELKELKQRQEEEERKRQEELAAKQTLPPSSQQETPTDRPDGESAGEAESAQQDGEKEAESRKVHDEAEKAAAPPSSPQASSAPSPMVSSAPTTPESPRPRGWPSPKPVITTSATMPRQSAKDTTPTTTRKKDRSRSKSPFRSFRWKKSTPKSPAQTSASDDEGNLERAAERPSPAAEESHLEGMLVRKHEWESTTKKASNRSWDKIYVVVRGTLLLSYKDSKSAKAAPEAYYKGEAPIDLRGGSTEVATDYTKKKHVLRLKLSNGAEFLFQAKDDEEMKQWVSVLSGLCDIEGSGGPSRSHTLPAPGDRKDEPKRRSFFTLKKS